MIIVILILVILTKLFTWMVFEFPQSGSDLDYGGRGLIPGKASTCPQPPEWIWCPPSQWTLIALFLGIQWPGHKADYSPIHKNALFFQVQ